MTSSRSTIIAIRALALCAAIVGSARLARAQQSSQVAGISARTYSAPGDRVQSDAELFAWRAARSEPQLILRDIDVSPTTQGQLNSVGRDFAGRLDALLDEGNATAVDGRVTTAFVSRINTMRLDQREAQRCQLPLPQQAEYDRNTMGNMTPAPKP